MQRLSKRLFLSKPLFQALANGVADVSGSKHSIIPRIRMGVQPSLTERHTSSITKPCGGHTRNKFCCVCFALAYVHLKSTKPHTKLLVRR